MPTRSGNPYLLGESSQVSTTSMESQPTVTFADIMTRLTAITQTVSDVRKDQQVDHERLAKLETSREPPKIEEPPVPPNGNHNAPNPDDQYLKSIKLDIPTFDGRHDPQLLLDWPQQLDRYFTWNPLMKFRKVKFASMKLTGQACTRRKICGRRKWV